MTVSHHEEIRPNIYPIWKYKIVNIKFIKVEGVNQLIPRFNEKVWIGKKLVFIPQIIKNRWVLIKRINNGGFGIVFSCLDRFTPNREFAIKIELYNSSTHNNEHRVYEDLHGFQNIPRVYDIGDVDETLSFIVLEKLREITKITKPKIFQMISILEYIVQHGWIHSDVKLSNFMERDDGSIVIIDFGLSTRLDEIENESRGTLLFMSINSHESINYFKNDFESLFYSLLSLEFTLPWECNNDWNDVLSLKRKLINDVVENTKAVRVIPKRLLHFIKYVLSINPNEPDFTRLKNLFL